MKKLLLIFALIIIGIPAAIMIAASMQPTDYHVERSASIAAPPDAVYPLVSDFHRFAEWSPWEKLDPSMQKGFDGPASGVGSIYTWSGNEKVGSGRMSMTEADPNKKVAAEVHMTRPWVSTTKSAWTLDTQGGVTKVTWSMDGTRDNLVAKAFSLFFNIDSMVGKDYEKGLAQLKDVAEAEAKKRTLAAQAAPAAAAAPGAATAAAAAPTAQ